MANTVYPKFREAYMTGTSLNLATADIRALLVDLADYTYSDAHDFLDDVAAGARVAVSGALTCSVISGPPPAFDCADFSFTTVSGDPSEAVIFYQHTGTEGTSRLLYFCDKGGSLTITPNGENINVTIPSSGVFTM